MAVSKADKAQAVEFLKEYPNILVVVVDYKNDYYGNLYYYLKFFCAETGFNIGHNIANALGMKPKENRIVRLSSYTIQNDFHQLKESLKLAGLENDVNLKLLK